MNLVYHNDDWILQRLGDAIQGATGASHGYPVARDTNVYLPYYLLGHGTQKDVCLFTHCEIAPELEAKTEKFFQAAKYADVCWAMSAKTATFLPTKKTFTLEIPADPILNLRRPLTIGVCGHAQPGDRKGLGRIKIAKDAGCNVKFTGGSLPFEQLPSWYQSLDYLLVTGKVEGGPLPVKEAIAMGVPVIAPDVGWCWDHPVIRYEGDEELEHIFRKLTAKDEWEGFFATLKENLA